VTADSTSTRSLAIVTPDTYCAISRSRATSDDQLTRLAKRHCVSVAVVRAIREEGATLRKAVEMMVRPGMRVRLDTPMNSGMRREPQVGEWGTVHKFASDDGGKVFVDWDGGSNLAVIPSRDRLSCVADDFKGEEHCRCGFVVHEYDDGRYRIRYADPKTGVVITRCPECGRDLDLRGQA
jgi:Domain of unknown function (DUF4314)